MVYIKLFPKNMIINGHQFKMGRNLLPYDSNSIYFYSIPNMLKYRSFIKFEPIIGFIYLKEDTPIFKVDSEFRSDEINIFKIMSFNNFFQNMNEYNQLRFVKNNPYSIEYIENPSETIQFASVNVFGEAIKYIRNPSEDVQIDAVRNYGLSIRHIKNPSEDVQIEAVRNNGNSINYIENPYVKALEISKMKIL